jgi:outer membrane protein assembly factor BamB
MRRLLSLTVAVCVAGATSRAADDVVPDRLDNWHQWRGPLATGVAPKGDPPLKWDEKTNIKWKVEVPGRGTSTPIVWKDQVFLLTAIDTGKAAAPADIPKRDERFDTKTKPPTTYHQFVVLALDRKTGQTRWKQTATEQVPHEGHHPTHSYAAGSPMTDGKFLYVSFGSRGIYCYDLDGKFQWKRDLGRMHTRFGWGEGTSPVIHGDAVVVNWDQEADSFIACLDAKTGQNRWKLNRDEPTSWATPLVVPHKGKDQVVVNGHKRVRSYDLANGKVIWECGGQTLNAIPCPVIRDGMAICMTGYRGSATRAISLDSTGDVTDKVAWRYDRGTPYVPSPLLVGDRLYFTQANTDVLTCLDAVTGKPLVERERLPNLKALYASPVAAADRIYFTGRDGTTVVIKRADKIEILATNRLPEGIDASPAIVGKQLFLRGEKHLYCIEAK